MRESYQERAGRERAERGRHPGYYYVAATSRDGRVLRGPYPTQGEAIAARNAASDRGTITFGVVYVNPHGKVT